MKRALQVHVEHGVHQVGCQVVETLVAQDACVVNHNVDTAVSVNSRLHDGCAALWGGNAVGVGNGNAAQGNYFVHHFLRCALVAAASVQCAAQVVDHHKCPAGSQQQRVLSAKPTTSARNNGYFAVKSQFCCAHKK